MMRRLLILCMACLWLSGIQAEEWPQFRGPQGNGISPEKPLPVQWSKDKAIRWQVDLPGRANSSPAVTASRVHLTTQLKDHSLWILTYSTKDGTLLRKTKVGTGKLAAKGSSRLYAHRHNAATPSPVADREHVWAFFGSGLVVCLHAESGEVVWKKDMNREYGPYNITFGMGSSPRLWKDLLIINCMTKGPSYVVALEKKTGKQKWHIKRKLPAKDDGPDAYSTPSIARINNRDVLLVSGSDHVTAHDPDSGKQRWISGGLTISSQFGRVIASPTASDNIIVATSANPGSQGLGHVMAIGGNGTGNITKSNRLWTHSKSTPDSSTPVCYQGRSYMVSDKGIGTCLDLKTGEVKWQKRISAGPFHASLVAGDGKVYFLGINGTCTVVKAADTFTKLSTNSLPESTFYATPAISNGTIYLRSYKRLYAIK